MTGTEPILESRHRNSFEAWVPVGIVSSTGAQSSNEWRWLDQDSSPKDGRQMTVSRYLNYTKPS